MSKKIIPCLWFNDNAQEAVNFYITIFKNSKINKINYFIIEVKESKQKKGSVMTIEFELEGQKFLALNGGPYFNFTPAISLIVNCKNQKELDEIWNKLSFDKSAEQCGWLKDKFGLSWQITPIELEKMISSKNTKKAQKVMKALLSMKKLDIKKLKEAYNEK